MRRIYSLIILVFLSLPAISQQIREFSVDTIEYVQELEKFMGDLNDEERPVLDGMVSLWQSDSITYDEKLEIISVSNLMLKRQARPKPHFLNYFTLYLMNQKGENKARNIHILLETFGDLVGNREIPFHQTERILTFSLDLINHDNLYNLAGTNWKALYGDYSFIREGDRPRVRYKNVDLYCYASRDTMKIFETSGIFDLLSLQWQGRGGRVTWERAGLDPEAVYAGLSRYDLDVTRSQYTADSVAFHYRKYFDYPLAGRLEEKAVPTSDPSLALYPKFYSYQSKYILPDLFSGIEYIGGLSMQGAKLVGTGSQGEPAVLNIFENDTLRMKLLTQNVLIRENGMNSRSVSTTFYLESDSIYHPDIQFIYAENEDEIRLTKGDNYTSGVPFRNTYHKVDMNFEELVWKRGTGIIKIQPSIGRAIGQATFESNNFFNYGYFEAIQGRDYINPLVSLWQFSREVNNLRQFPVTAYAGNVGMAPYQVRHQLMKLSRMGFLFFDEEKDLIRLNDKLFYYLDASVGQTDYDVINFISKVNAPKQNASLNIFNNDLTIYGIPQIFLSDSQNVVLTPKDNMIVMKRNRNFLFNGEISAGLFTYYGNNFFFNYDSFKINLQDIDSMRLQVTSVDDNTGVRTNQLIDNLVEDVTGELLIDDPENKSGLEDYAQYPVFTSREFAYVYFDEPQIQKGVYKREDVYFELEPFSIDSLDNFSRTGMKLKGKFVSPMLPPLEQTLTLMDDNSLGFSYTPPEEGIPIYDGKGTAYNLVEMSSKGLHSSGQLDYLTSTTLSDDFLFHPDSVMGTGREFRVRKQLSGTQFPEVSSTDIEIKWKTNEEEFYASRINNPFAMYNDSVQLKGDLLLKPSGLSGNGTVDLITSALLSDNFEFRADNILADSSEFRLNSVNSDQLAISAVNVRANIDFNNSTGQFYANEDYALVEFPSIRYISNLDFFEWDIKDEVIAMGLNNTEGETGEDSLSGPRYISVHPAQDSLNFVSALANYDYRKEELEATEVPYIQVADSRIYPDEGNVIVRKNAAMGKLHNARLIIDYKTEKYPLYNAELTVQSRNSYTGNADYDYLDFTKDPQTISFKTIFVDTSGQSIAMGEVSVSDSFRLSPFFNYQGKFTLEARKEYLYFDGATLLSHDCNIGKSWLKFKAEINPDSVMIPVAEQALDVNLNPVYFGSMITRDSTHVYSAFASLRKDFFDAYLTNAYGWLKYNRNLQKYELAGRDKLMDPASTGNYLALDYLNCELYGEGEINFQVDYGLLDMKTPGTAVHKISEDKFETNVMMAMDFLFSDNALDEFGRELDSLPQLEPYDITDTLYKKSLSELVGKDAAERMETDISLYGELRTIPDEFRQTLILSGVQLNWHQASRTFRYHGDVAVVRVGDRQINKKVEAYIELTKRSSGDLLDIYLVANDRTWYYFGYNPGSLQAISSNRKFNQILLDTKENDRKVKSRPGTTGFIYSAAAERRAQLFLRRFMAGEDQQASQ